MNARVESVANPVRVMIVDDHEVVRKGLSIGLRDQPNVSIVALADSGDRALELFDVARPDVVVLDYRLPGRSGAAVCSEMLRRRPDTAVLILTNYMEDGVLMSCLEAGARGFLTKTISLESLTDAVFRLARGETVLAPEVIPRVIDWARSAKQSWTGIAPMAPFEIEILRRLSEGWSNKQIAISQGVSEEAIKGRVRLIKKHLGASDRAHAVAKASKMDLI